MISKAMLVKQREEMHERELEMKMRREEEEEKALRKEDILVLQKY